MFAFVARLSNALHTQRSRDGIALLAAIVFSTWACVPQASGAHQSIPAVQGQAPAVTHITQISLERSCYGCDKQYRVSFRHDGAATRTVYGNRHRGDNTDRVFTGTVAPEAFADLVRTLEREGFFQLDERYPPPEHDRTGDGSWSTTSASFDNTTRAVLNRNKQGPPQLKLIEDAIDSLAAGVAWSPEQP